MILSPLLAALLALLVGWLVVWAFLPTQHRKTQMNYSFSDRQSQPSDSKINGEKLRLLAIGSVAGVTETIHTLHRLGFAEVGAWSPLLPAPTEGEVMSILTRHRRAIE